ncbi:hypothetical protein OVA24_19330 [Luteolibacter sp. SL250]|uniref:hypothetical protein n=1 Tax=Luteolibacter sp. SL250 TaxID=2995170 RepID=UPI0022710F49|nr:hypothetical protein [Luteolibacter sp. SL250]WAC19384.1 hypothetical protein OVA24_19330 [Luteolibacter sp. SL250]
MSQSPFNDRRALNLLSRVGDDLSQLRQDVAPLISHTAHRTVPDGARQLADTARHQLESGGAYAAARLRALRSTPQREAVGLAGGLLLAGLVAFGVYAICKGRCEREYPEDGDGY